MEGKRYLILEHSSRRFVCQGLRRLHEDAGVEIEEPDMKSFREDADVHVLVFDKKTDGVFVVPNVEPTQFEGVAQYYHSGSKSGYNRNKFYFDVLDHLNRSLAIKTMILITEAMRKYSTSNRELGAPVYSLSGSTFFPTGKNGDVERYHYSYHHNLMYFDDGNEKHLIYYKGKWA